MHKLVETPDGVIWIENNVKQFIPGIFVHWDINTWSPSKVKYYKYMWNEVIAPKLRKAYGNVYAIPPSQKEEKLIRLFGFVDSEITLQGNKLLIYV